MVEHSTLPAYMQRNAREMGDQPAMREKFLGIWKTYTWSEYAQEVRDFAQGIASLKFERGDKLGIIGNNLPKLYWAQVAAQSIGGTAVPVYQDAIAKELAFVLNHSGAKIIVAEDQEQVDKILSIKDELPSLEHLIYCDPRGMTDYDEAILNSYDDVRHAGQTFAASNNSYFDDEVGKTTGADIALMCYTLSLIHI